MKCSSCDKEFVYPFQKCPHCGANLKTKAGGELKVIGVTEVMIPSIGNEQVPYFVLLLAGKDGKKEFVKNSKPYKVGDLFSKKSVPKMRLKIGVVGTGTMGLGIAALALSHGFEVTMKSRSEKSLQNGKVQMEDILTKYYLKRIEDFEKNLTLTTSYTDLSGLDLIIESVSEDLEIKREIFRKLDAICPPSTVLATNTSALSINSLTTVTKNPSRVIGIHFFNPIHRMKLVEIISGAKTDKRSRECAVYFAIEVDKQPIVVKDSPGFIVNRLAIPFINEAVRLFENGISNPRDIDIAVKNGLNHPMGPFELADLIGIDVVVAILHELHQRTGDAALAPCAMLLKMNSEGKLGRKSGQGFYSYSKNG
jgi:3-hydroxybutyryl-CoA dehydrogenase